MEISAFTSPVPVYNFAMLSGFSDIKSKIIYMYVETFEIFASKYKEIQAGSIWKVKFCFGVEVFSALKMSIFVFGH